MSNAERYDDDERTPLEGEIMTMSQEVSPAIAAEINQQVATAKRYPRRRDQEVSDEIMGRATLNEEIAAECMYSLKRGRGDDATVIAGPSIRFAEIVRASFGNIRVAARFVRLDLDDPERGAIIVEAAALDLQTNNAEIIPVRRSVMTSGYGNKKPRVYNADMINMTVNAASSIARRNAILAVVPKAVWITAYQRVVKVLQGDATTLGKRRADLIEAFKRVGVKPETVYASIGVKGIEDITLEHMPQLVGFATAIKEGEAPDSVFGKAAAETGDHAKVQNPLADKGDETPAAATATKKTETKPAVKAKEPVKEPEANPIEGITTAEQYRVYALAWIETEGDLKEAKDRWAREYDKRKELKLNEDIMLEIQTARQKKLAALAPKADAA